MNDPRNNKTEALERMYRLMLCIIASIAIFVWILLIYIWPTPQTYAQQRDFVIGAICFALGVALWQRLMFRKYQITGKEFQAYCYSKPLTKISSIIVVIAALIKVIESFK